MSFTPQLAPPPRLTVTAALRVLLWSWCAALPHCTPQEAVRAPVAATHAPNVAPDPNAFRNEIPPSLPAPTTRYPVTRVDRLPSGFELRTVTRQTLTQSVRLVCRAGSELDPEGKSGLAALTTRMLTEGTQQSDSFDFAVQIEALGSTLDYATSHDLSSLELELLPNDLQRGLQLLWQAVLTPAFQEERFAQVKDEVQNDLTNNYQSPPRLAFLIAMRALLGSHHGRNSEGTPTQVEGLQPADVRGFHQAWFVPERCALLTAGPIGPDVLLPLVAEQTRSWSRGTSEPPSKVESIPAAPTKPRALLFERPGAVQTALAFVYPLPPRSSQDYETIRLVNNAFGGLFTSRLNNNLREQHAYTYGAHSSYLTTNTFGVWLSSSNVRSAVTADAVKEYFSELTRLGSAPLTDDELKRARADLTLGPSARLAHNGLLLDNVEEEFTFALPPDYFATLKERLLSADRTKLAQVAGSLSAVQPIVVAVGDPAALRAVADLLGQSETVDLTWLQ